MTAHNQASRTAKSRGRNNIIVVARPERKSRSMTDTERLIHLSRQCDCVYDLIQGWWEYADSPKDDAGVPVLSRALAKVQAAMAAYKNAIADVITDQIEKA